MDSTKVLYLLLASVGINRMSSLVPAYRYFDPFPFHNIVDAEGNSIGITMQSYVYGISTHTTVMILIFIIGSMVQKMAGLFEKIFYLEALSLVDYLLIYENPLFHVGSYGVEFTDFKILMYLILIIQWNNSKAN